MNSTDEFYDEEPFVREECGDTMYDEEVLNALTASVESPQPSPPAAPETEHNYASLAFTEPIKALQDRYGSRSAYARVEKQTTFAGLTPVEVAFIANRDSFYMASIGENGFPYIQHRGGPKGFLHVLDAKTLGFVDFSGNKQYISVGNIQTHPQVSLILVDYPRQARLKLYAEAEIVELANRPDLLTQLNPTGYKHKPERIILLHIRATDWNCPQHITPRYTVDEIDAAFNQ